MGEAAETAVNSARRCAHHPGSDALDPCARCGRFFCGVCLLEAKLVEAPVSGRCPECEAAMPAAPWPIGGWLLFSLLHVALLEPAMMVQSIVAVMKEPGTPAVVRVFAIAFTLVRQLFATVVLVLFVRRKRAARWLLVALYAGELSLGALGVLVLALRDGFGAGVPLEHLAGLGLGLLALAALVFGERPKRTFTL